MQRWFRHGALLYAYVTPNAPTKRSIAHPTSKSQQDFDVSFETTHLQEQETRSAIAIVMWTERYGVLLNCGGKAEQPITPSQSSVSFLPVVEFFHRN